MSRCGIARTEATRGGSTRPNKGDLAKLTALACRWNAFRGRRLRGYPETRYRSTQSILGVDVGGVIVDRVAEGQDTSSFGSRPLLTPAVPGVFDALAVLTEGPFEGRVHIVSKAGSRVAANTEAWLEHHALFRRTGIPAGNLHFVRTQADKAPVCARLGITHFVDDRLDVLASLTTVPHRYLFAGGLGAQQPPKHVPPWAAVAQTWPTLVGLLRNGPASVPDRSS